VHLPHIPKQWRVPQQSVLARVRADDAFGILEGGLAEENMNVWTISTGARLPDGAVHVEAGKIVERVIVSLELAA
jgi:hypothetical protein